MNFEQLIQLQRESVLCTGGYAPDDAFMQEKSVVITLASKVILMVGLSSETESFAIAERLLNDRCFLDMVEYCCGSRQALRHTVMHNSAICSKDVFYPAVLLKPQDEEAELDATHLVAVVPIQKPILAMALCVSNSLMLDFCPNAPPLSLDIRLNKEPRLLC